jgi:transcriptional regulator with XRE-family HTH domain
MASMSPKSEKPGAQGGGKNTTHSRVDKAENSRGLEPRIGKIIALKRRELGLRASDLARALGITASRLARIERGRGRIEASLLFVLARQFGVDIAWFYVETGRQPANIPAGLEMCREVQDLIRAYWKISDARLRLKLALLARALGDGSPENP